MPLVVITGIPSSGKSRLAKRLSEFLINEKGKKATIVSENPLIDGPEKNQKLEDFRKEKEIRGVLKSEVIRLLNKDDVVILDALNYIKGYRYELYCASKSVKTTQITIHCDVSPEDSWNWNLEREEGEKYTKEMFDAMVMRYETPSSFSRWDTPLLLDMKPIPLDLETAYDALFNRKPPPPNQSTQCQPLSSTSFLYELDKVTKDIVDAILQAQRMGQYEGEEIVVPGTKEKVILFHRTTMSELSRTRRSFITYIKAKAINDIPKTASMFVQFINKSLGVDAEDNDDY